MLRRITVLASLWLLFCPPAALVWSADTATPAPATQPEDLSSTPALSGSPQQQLDAAKADAAKARGDFTQLVEAAVAKLENDPDYKAAVANVDAAKKQLDDARQSGSADLSSYSQQYLDALARVSTMKNAVNSDPSIAAAKQKADAASKVVATIQSEIDRQAESKSTERPTGYSEAQWTLAQAAFDYRSKCVSEIAEAQKALDSPNEPVIMFGGNGGVPPVEPKSPETAKAQREWVDMLKDRRDKISRGQVVVPDITALPLTAGNAGHLDLRFVVEQVISKTEMIAHPFSRVLDPAASLRYARLHWAKDAETQDLWISGYSTTGLADDQQAEVKGDFFVSGSKTYPTASGRRTILILERVDTSNLKPALDYLILQSRLPHRAAPDQ